MKDNNFIMISGPAASGKSTLVYKMKKELSGFIFKPSLAYIELAKNNGIPIDRAFFDITRDMATDYFCEICNQHELVIGDQHLAMQHYKDSMLASCNSDMIFPEEPYISTIDYNLFDKLSNNQIKTLLIYLKASPEILFERAYQRHINDGTPIRNKTLKEVIEEVEAEYYYFNELIHKTGIDNYIIATDNKNPEEVLGNALRKVRKFRG